MSLAGELKPRGANLVNIDDWEVADNYQSKGRDNTTHFVYHDHNGKFLFAKISQRQSSTFIGGHKRCIDLAKTFSKHGELRPRISRGKERGANGATYTVHGVRKDPNGNGVSNYAWKPDTKDEDKEKIEKVMAKLELQMEKCTRAVDGGMIESTVAAEAVKLIDLPAPSSEPEGSDENLSKRTYQAPPYQFGTALSVGENYWSPTHIDPDFYFTCVIFIAPESQAKQRYNDVLHYFCFPDYKIKVPMRSGETLIFNPSVAHACSNPRFRNSFAASNFCPIKTVREQTSQTFNKEPK